MDEEIKGYITRLISSIDRILNMLSISKQAITLLTDRLFELEKKVKKLEERNETNKKRKNKKHT